MSTLIVGGGGFVGAYLIRRLLSSDDKEVHVTKLSGETVEVTADGLHVSDMDIRRPDDVLRTLERIRPERIYHLAGQSSAALSWEKPALTFEVNTIGAINLLEAVRRLDISPRILLVGSGEEYGTNLPSVSPIKETSSTRPSNPYALSKLAQSIIGTIYYNAYNMQTLAVRAFNHVGPGQTESFVVADFCKQVAEIEHGLREPVLHVGNLSAVRDFTDVRDVVRAYAAIMEKGVAGRIYNVGGGAVCSIRELVERILSLAKCSISVETEPSKMRPVDVPFISADITQLQKDTGYSARFTLNETLLNTLNYWRQKCSVS